VVAIAGVCVAASTSAPQMPFDSAVWKSTPSDPAARQTVRYQMRKGAKSAAQKCQTVAEIKALLGPPNYSTDYGERKNDEEPAHGLIYVLGLSRRTMVFWEKPHRVLLEVVTDRKNHVLDAYTRRDESQ
jgi:hypothetical protein